MKRLIIISLLILTGCFDDISEIKSQIATIKANTTAYIEPMPEVIVFTSFNYSSEAQRSPFVAPKPEAIQEKMQQMSDCLSPDPHRHKQPLEKFALGDLVMRGTLGDEHSLSALLEASDATFYRVSVGNYVGLFNGRIIQVGSKSLTIVELTPDGAGCWVERETVMNLATSNQEG
jgi:type IV pilus assembly protein PilP|tara:strand:+ start:26 stop:550 length:525 start_codon:yes stop_codon:yes gene_type:complete